MRPAALFTTPGSRRVVLDIPTAMQVLRKGCGAPSLRARQGLPACRCPLPFHPVSSNAGPNSPRARDISVCAKGKKGAAAVDDVPKGKAGKAAKADVDIAQLEKEAKADVEDRMKKALAAMADNFNTIRTGRANPAILDKIMVDYDGVPAPLKSVASISVPDSSTLLISPFDKASMKLIEKAINESDLGINPNNDGDKIRLGLPQPTQDRRKELVKQVSKFGEEAKVAVRNVRKDVMKKLDKHGDAFSKVSWPGAYGSLQELVLPCLPGVSLLQHIPPLLSRHQVPSQRQNHRTPH
ncbi:ribosome recycling factor domain-containing protein [Haematococcus lacustris]